MRQAVRVHDMSPFPALQQLTVDLTHILNINAICHLKCTEMLVYCAMHRWDDFFANCKAFFFRPCRVDVMVRAYCFLADPALHWPDAAQGVIMSVTQSGYKSVTTNSALTMLKLASCQSWMLLLLQAMHFYTPCDIEVFKK